MLYNDPYIAHLKGKHPVALGKAGRDVWTEIWPVIGPMLEGVMQTGEATYSDDLQLFLERNGYPEETYHTFSYSALKDGSGQIVGIFTPVAETTERVISERRLRTLGELARTKAETEEQLLPVLASVLKTNKMDLPLCGFYNLDTHSRRCELLVSSTDNEDVLAYLTASSLIENLKKSTESATMATLEISHDDSLRLPKSELGLALKRAVIYPVPTHKGNEWLLCFAAVSPHQEFNDRTVSFIESVTREMATALKDARAYEQERRKADELERLDRAKTVFFNNVSHEFRTPITLMLGPLEKLLTRKFEAEDHFDLEIIQRNALRMLKLVNSLLDFSRIEADRYDGRFVPTNLSNFTCELASLFRSAIENEGLEFEVTTAPLQEKAYLDREMWEKIVLNLVSNAFKFTRAGKISVSLKQNAKNFELTVRDTGIGISEDELPNIFKRFHRIKADGARTYEGSGIGLAMVHELVRLHGGSVAVTSEPGAGTEFIVSIPTGYSHLPFDQVVHQGADKPELRHAAAFLQETEGWRSMSARLDPHLEIDSVQSTSDQQRVLVADDNADMREYLHRLLSPFWSVELVLNGGEALAALKREPADLVIADIMMPEVDGIELLQAIRSSETLQNTPVLLLSARAGEEARAEGIEKGANDYLVKPFSTRELCARVTRLLQQRMSAQSLELAVKERTFELEAALQAKSRFLATVSHEVRTPMAGIMGLVELILESASEPAIQVLATHAFESCKRLLRILNDLLDASKLQAGKLTLEYRDFAIHHVIGDIVQLARSDADKKSLEITSKVRPEVPDLVSGDELRIRQILSNLLFNAVKFTEEGKIHVEVAVLNDSPEVVTLRFSVQDTGIGISAEQQQKLFRPFEQLTDSTARVFGGTGLGLNICLTLTELMHGKIGVDSAPGDGSTFWVQIPFRKAACLNSY
jgi:signal transduction histidine kinase